MLIFIDTSVFIALMVSTEIWHKKCLAKYQEYSKKQTIFYTNDLVLAELYTRLVYDFGKQACVKAIKTIGSLREQGYLRVFQTDAALFSRAEEAIVKFAEHKLSFTDASIYSLVKLYRIDEVFTLDADFKKVGLAVVKIDF